MKGVRLFGQRYRQLGLPKIRRNFEMAFLVQTRIHSLLYLPTRPLIVTGSLAAACCSAHANRTTALAATVRKVSEREAARCALVNWKATGGSLAFAVCRM